MIEPILTYGKLRLFNVPGGKPVYDEVLVADCYRKDTIPENSIVIDVGGFYGEFGLWCAVVRNCQAYIFEPSSVSWPVAMANAVVNGIDFDFHVIKQMAVTGKPGYRHFVQNPTHPAGSRFDDMTEEQAVVELVKCTTLIGVMDYYNIDSDDGREICVKLDCEGAEREIFQDVSWLDRVSWLAMEWHNKDAALYLDILLSKGFKVELSDENPEVVRGTLWACREPGRTATKP